VPHGSDERSIYVVGRKEQFPSQSCSCRRAKTAARASPQMTGLLRAGSRHGPLRAVLEPATRHRVALETETGRSLPQPKAAQKRQVIVTHPDILRQRPELACVSPAHHQVMHIKDVTQMPHDHFCIL
jgi:hypothetical protein